MRHPTVVPVSGLALVLVASAAVAGHPRSEYGTVVQVDPIIERVEYPVEREDCWREPVRYREPVVYRTGYRERDRAPALLGAIVGGVIGNQFGSGRGRDAATVAGAALGYAAVRDGQRHGGYRYASREIVREERRCAVRTDYEVEERVTGYEVTYRYRGETYRTTTDYHPGDRIELVVDVRPAR